MNSLLLLLVGLAIGIVILGLHVSIYVVFLSVLMILFMVVLMIYMGGTPLRSSTQYDTKEWLRREQRELDRIKDIIQGRYIEKSEEDDWSDKHW